LSSSAFDHGGTIPLRHTCDGEDGSPPLEWSDVPAGVKSFALIVEDPDAPDPAAPRRIWVHWVRYNLDPATRSVREGLPVGAGGGFEGRNDWGAVGYRGPCPPIGRHRYIHRLFALDAMLPDLGEPDKAMLVDAMAGHIVATAELIGMYASAGPRPPNR
jgi:Raf kinase inhibitor-like YbhB/YbcL family protein